ncbi:MAG TPA: hypothetical protein VGB17_06235 [Pyrinomonadaceae bacterium]|jgi:hypothetical protein
MRFKSEQGNTSGRVEEKMRARLSAVSFFIHARARRSISLYLFILLFVFILAAGCRWTGSKQSVRPRSLMDVPAQRLAYRFEPDIEAPPNAAAEEAQQLATVQNDFNSRRTEDALVRTISSPDGQRALALYETGEDRPGELRIDMYSADGNFLRNITPPDLIIDRGSATVAWSPDGNHITFNGRKSFKPQPQPTPPDQLPEAAGAMPSPATSVAPNFVPVPVYETEQVYICNRDGFDLRPLTARDGLIYFNLAWAPDSHALAALACKESEWNTREQAEKLPVGRPRLLSLDGKERLLDDGLAGAPPAWSPDSSKVAAAFETDVGLYDAATETPTSARIPLRETLLSASAGYDEKNLKKAGNPPVSFNPIVQLSWPQPESLYVKTAFVNTNPTDPVNNFQRWHLLHLTPQATALSQAQKRASARTSI